MNGTRKPGNVKTAPQKPVLNKSKLITAILCFAAAVYVVIKLLVLEKEFSTLDYVIIGTVAIGGMLLNARSGTSH